MKMYSVLNQASHQEDVWGSGGIVVPCILNLGTRWSELSASCPCCFTLEERALNTHWTAGWVGFRAGLNVMAKRIPAPAGNQTPIV